jgi:chaperonin GroES
MEPEENPQPGPEDRRSELAGAEGNIVDLLNERVLTTLGNDVVEDYERDLADEKGWREKAEAAVKAAAQEKPDAKDHPWPNAANVKYPMLTVAALQFQARAYPAIVKGDEAVTIKVVGRDEGRPVIGPDGQPAMQINGQPIMASQLAQIDPASLPGQPQPLWQVPPGAKKARGERVKDYLNTYIFYRMKGWEQDTDQMLLMLPIIGCMFRKVYKKGGEFKSRSVSGLKIVAPTWATDCRHAPRLTEEIDNLATYQVKQRMRAGFYREVVWPEVDGDDQKPRLILEQHRFEDLDGDGIAEPYIITVDHESRQVLRLEANYGPEQLNDADGDVDKLSCYYVKFDFLPNPEGHFKGIGFGHLLTEITEVVNTTINQLIDAGTAQIAGGGFIAAGLRLQAKGQTYVRFRPGEYKTVDASADQLRAGFVERTFPQPSPVAFQLLDMMLAAARDIASVKDVITGDASNNGQVGTTLALIEQGLQVFTAIYKRVYRSLKEEFTLLFECMSMWGDEKLAQDYMRVLDDPDADFSADFDLGDFDIRPVSDPTSVTRMQKLGRAQFMLNFLGKGLNDIEIMRNALEAADVEDVERYMPEGPPQPDPLAIAKAKRDEAGAAKDAASAQKTGLEATALAHNLGLQMGAMNAGQPEQPGADFSGGLPGMEGTPGNEMALPGM